MRIKYTGKLSVAVLVFMMFAVSRLPAQSGTGTGTKDGGGIVFYDKGVYTDGWRYLEAAPAETEFRAEWGAYGKKAVVDIGTEPGSGMRNTEVIAAYLDGIKESGKAAQRCRDLSYGGFDDWFLPCKDELDLMYKNLKVQVWAASGTAGTGLLPKAIFTARVSRGSKTACSFTTLITSRTMQFPSAPCAFSDIGGNAKTAMVVKSGPTPLCSYRVMPGKFIAGGL